jgi:hypothetical protein
VLIVDAVPGGPPGVLVEVARGELPGEVPAVTVGGRFGLGAGRVLAIAENVPAPLGGVERPGPSVGRVSVVAVRPGMAAGVVSGGLPGAGWAVAVDWRVGVVVGRAGVVAEFVPGGSSGTGQVPPVESQGVGSRPELELAELAGVGKALAAGLLGVERRPAGAGRAGAVVEVARAEPGGGGETLTTGSPGAARIAAGAGRAGMVAPGARRGGVAALGARRAAVPAL